MPVNSVISREGDRVTTRTNKRWRLGDDRHIIQKSGYLDPVHEGKVQSGSLLGKVTATSLLRACGVGFVPAAATSETQTLSDTSMFEVGDEVEVYEADDVTLLDTLTITEINGNDIVLSGSVATENGSIIRRTDGSDALVGVLAHDASTNQGVNEQGVPVFAHEGVTYYIKGWVDYTYIKGGSAVLKAELIALGFTVEN